MILFYGFGVSLMNTNEDACREHTYLPYVTTVAAISFPCWAAFDQYVGTSRNVATRNRWGSHRVVRLVIICTVIFWILIYIPVIFLTGIINHVCTFKPGVYTKFNTYVFTPLVYGVGPASIITYCTLGIVKNIRSNNVHQSHEKLAKQVRAMLMSQLVILAISGIPFGFQNIYIDITNNIVKEAFRVALESFFGQVILIFYHSNYVSTFYIYVYKSNEIRKVLKKQFYQCIGRQRSNLIDAATDNSNRLQQIHSAG